MQNEFSNWNIIHTFTVNLFFGVTWLTSTDPLQGSVCHFHSSVWLTHLVLFLTDMTIGEIFKDRIHYNLTFSRWQKQPEKQLGHWRESEPVYFWWHLLWFTARSAVRSWYQNWYAPNSLFNYLFFFCIHPFAYISCDFHLHPCQWKNSLHLKDKGSVFGLSDL